MRHIIPGGKYANAPNYALERNSIKIWTLDGILDRIESASLTATTPTRVVTRHGVSSSSTTWTYARLNRAQEPESSSPFRTRARLDGKVDIGIATPPQAHFSLSPLPTTVLFAMILNTIICMCACLVSCGNIFAKIFYSTMSKTHIQTQRHTRTTFHNCANGYLMAAQLI